MARVRRINVSQIEGDYSNDSDKRPKGEMGLYEDGDGGFDLVIHDGVNGTYLNKVFGKGKFYGHNEDSGDGSGFDTIKLIPDIGLYESGSHQYIIVDPTAPNHIHLRAGGDQDSSNADLFLGAENTNVKVSDQLDTVSINCGGSSQWTFGSDNILSLPGGGLIDGSDGNVEVRGMTNFNVEAVGGFNITTNAQGITNYQWGFGDDGNLLIPMGSTISTGYGGTTILSESGNIDPNPGDLLNGALYVSSGQISISYNQQSSMGGPELRYQWDFNSNNGLLQLPGNGGGIEFPDGTTQSTAWAGGRVVDVPTSSIGNTGDLQGDIAFNSSYMYYCTQNFAGTVYTIESISSGGASNPYLNMYSTSQGFTSADLTGYTVSGPGGYSGTVTGPSQDQGGSLWRIPVSPNIIQQAGNYVFNSPSGNIWKRVAWSNDTW